MRPVIVFEVPSAAVCGSTTNQQSMPARTHAQAPLERHQHLAVVKQDRPAFHHRPRRLRPSSRDRRRPHPLARHAQATPLTALASRPSRRSPPHPPPGERLPAREPDHRRGRPLAGPRVRPAPRDRGASRPRRGSPIRRAEQQQRQRCRRQDHLMRPQASPVPRRPSRCGRDRADPAVPHRAGSATVPNPLDG